MGHVIRAALCADAIFRDWAALADILCVTSIEELSALLNAEPVEWIFSVANPFILPADVFGKARRGAFNYHDGPLPRYAGTHATSWALLARETEHGITWHRIDHGVGTGELVVQRQVLIATSDTTPRCCGLSAMGSIRTRSGSDDARLRLWPVSYQSIGVVQGSRRR
ncbi:hypothetical protein IVA79_14320 [Bradyrhizobium sp. 138]|nr:hypothetical protein [Bradyrhizobium sp. 138]